MFRLFHQLNELELLKLRKQFAIRERMGKMPYRHLKSFEDLLKCFVPPKLKEENKEKNGRDFTEITSAAIIFGKTLSDICPESRELDKAIEHIEEAVMWAEKAILVSQLDSAQQKTLLANIEKLLTKESEEKTE